MNTPAEKPFGKANLLLALILLCAIGFIFQSGSKVLRGMALEEDQVQIIQEAPPPPVAIKKPPKPVPPKPEPVRLAPKPRPQNTPPPPPVFGLTVEAANQTGDMAVPTGNTLMKPDTVVQKTPPPPTAPVDLDKRPAVLNQVVPEYPAWAEDQGVTSTVKLLVTIDNKGQVQSVTVQKSGGKDFDQNAIKAVKATKFQPLVRDGVALPARFLFTYQFTL